MDINRENLDTVFRGLRSDFEGGLRHGMAQSADTFVTTIQSSTASERFDWLGDLPEMREWLGARHIHQLATHKYEVFHRDWEVTIRGLRKDFADDRIGIYKQQAYSGGEAAGLLKVRLACETLDAGDANLCYDGQPFFDTEHPVGEDGDISLVSNLLNGGGASAASPWYIMDLTRSVKPVIITEREAPTFVAKTSWSDNNVFYDQEFLFGSQARMGSGYGLWQTCIRNEGELNVANLMATRFAMSQFKGDKKNPAGQRKLLGMNGKVLVCGMANEEKALASIKNPALVSRTDSLAVAASNAQNPAYNLFQIVVVNWLP